MYSQHTAFYSKQIIHQQSPPLLMENKINIHNSLEEFSCENKQVDMISVCIISKPSYSAAAYSN